MPVILLTAPALADDAADRAAVTSLASAVASALDLAPDGVLVSLVHSAAGVDGTGAPALWPVAQLHGSRRDAQAMAAALAAARDSVAAAWDCPAEQVWAQWLVVEP